MPRPYNPLGKLQEAFCGQRWQAKQRGIAWQLTFAEWLAIWRESGKLEMRGRGRGRFCMARHGDRGPYAVGNVSIKLSSDNCTESFETKPYLDRKGRIGGPTGVGGGIGCYYRGANRRRPWQTVFRGKYVGVFVTEAEARRAYVERASAYLASVGKDLPENLK